MDQPIAYAADGRPLFDNAPTVVSVIISDQAGNVFAVRRANEPGKGLLGLPGGYHMRGESWREAGAREVAEEIGLAIHPAPLAVQSVETDEYGNNLIVAVYPVPFSVDPSPQDGEALEVVRIGMKEMFDPETVWAFPKHRAAVVHHLSEVHKRLLIQRGAITRH